MTKKTFLTKLKTKLAILEKNEIDDIVEEYSSHIAVKIEEGKNEKEAVADFGDIDELANEILSAYKINSEYQKEDIGRFEKLINDFIENMVMFFTKLFDSVAEQKMSKILVTIVYVIVALLLFGLLLWFIRIPFELANDIGIGIINIGGSNLLSQTFVFIWDLFIMVSSLVVTIVIAAALIKKGLTYFDGSEILKTDIVKEDLEASVKTVKEKVIKSDEKNAILDLFSTVAKILVVVFLFIPLILTDIGLAVGFGALIFFMIQGIISIGFTLMTLGALIISGTMTILITKFLFGKGGVK